MDFLKRFCLLSLSGVMAPALAEAFYEIKKISKNETEIIKTGEHTVVPNFWALLFLCSES